MSGEVLQEPTIVHPPVTLPCPLRGDTVTLGGLCEGGYLAWRVRDNTLVVNDAKTGECLQLWRPVTNGNIIHVTELDLHLPDGPLFLVTIEDHNQYTLAVLSPSASKLIQAIVVPYPITVIHPISIPGSLNTDSNLESGYHQSSLFGDSPIGCFSGVAAVGCLGGRVLLIDLHLNSQNSFPVSLLSPSQLHIVGGGVSVEDVEGIRESGGQVCVELMEGME